MNLTADEKKVWTSAYAAAYVADFTEMRRIAELVGPRGQSPATYFPFDEAAKKTSAEYAVTVANLAVEKLRSWTYEQNLGDVPIETTQP
mgnify:CR=1 FL=1